MVVDDANDHVMSVWDLSKSHPKKITETKVSYLPARNPPTPRALLDLELSQPKAPLLINYSLAERRILLARTTQDSPLIFNIPQLSLEFSPLAMFIGSLHSLSACFSSEFG